MKLKEGRIDQSIWDERKKHKKRKQISKNERRKDLLRNTESKNAFKSDWK